MKVFSCYLLDDGRIRIQSRIHTSPKDPDPDPGGSKIMDPTVETRLHRGDFPTLGIPVEGENEEPYRLVAVVLF